ncbi:MAG TPA: helix-turn-helix domain-containing protein [Candidatus Binatia bacterium]|nr:helix-turn-helix domain-containing protein [Candidatus Binatia bacterium]
MEDEVRAPSSADFGTLLRRHRLAAGLSQEALAERAHMSTNGIGALERGYRRTPQRETLELLVSALALEGEQREAFETAALATPRRAGGSVTLGPWTGHGASPLPLALTSFVGRDAELAEIASLVREYRLVTLTGSGGVGKTQTALRAAAALADDGESVVRFASLATADDSALVDAVADAIGVRDAGSRPLLETLLGYLKNKSLLLILDNCEHVVSEAASFVDALLAACPDVRVLATSREPLRTAGERTFRLPSLSEPGSLELFADRARAVEHRFEINRENAAAVAELCRRLDGIPLAIELAAARVNLLSVKALTERLDARFRILSGGERTALARHQTMRATIEWSFNLLSEREQRLFERLAIFVGGCTLAGAEAVASDAELAPGDVFDLVSSLTEKSLVVADVEAVRPRYRLLESTRAFASEKLAASDERAELARRHALWMAELADRAAATGRTMPTQPWGIEFGPELDDARAAFEWALFANEHAIAARIAAGFTSVWLTMRGQTEPRRMLDAVIPHLDPEGAPAIAAQVWRTRATLTFAADRIEAARRALELDERGGDYFGQVVSLYQITAGLLQSGRIEEAEAINDRAMRICREHGLTSSRRYAWVLDIGARRAARLGLVEEARSLYADALSVMIAFGDELDAATIRQNIGELEFGEGRYEQALEYAESALASARRADLKHREGSAMTNSAACRLMLGDVDGAYLTAREALALVQGAQTFETTVAIQHLATVAALRGDAELAARLSGYVDAWYARVGYERDVTERKTSEVLTAALRARLSEDEIAALAAAGAHLTEEQAAADAFG